MAGVAGFEPANQGVKVPSLNLLAIPLYGAGDGNRTHILSLED